MDADRIVIVLSILLLADFRFCSEDLSEELKNVDMLDSVEHSKLIEKRDILRKNPLMGLTAYQLLDLVEKQNESIRIQNETISEFKFQMSQMSSVISKNDETINEKDEEILAKENEILEKNKEIKRIQELLVEQENVIQEKTQMIDRNNELSIKRDKEFLEKEKIFDKQKEELTDQVNSISQNLSGTIDELSKCVQVDNCPYVGTGIYKIKLPTSPSFEVACDGNGWIVILRRMDGSVDFNRTWIEYKEGFGNITGEFFIGLEKLHLITQSRPYELKIQLGDIDGDTGLAQYDDFQIASEEKFYALELLGSSSGNARDALNFHRNMNFSTFDNDNDKDIDGNCGRYYGAGWWFNHCSTSALTGKYNQDGQTRGAVGGIMWTLWKPKEISLTTAQMMIRPKFNLL